MVKELNGFSLNVHASGITTQLKKVMSHVTVCDSMTHRFMLNQHQGFIYSFFFLNQVMAGKDHSRKM